LRSHLLCLLTAANPKPSSRGGALPHFVQRELLCLDGPQGNMALRPSTSSCARSANDRGYAPHSDGDGVGRTVLRCRGSALGGSLTGHQRRAASCSAQRPGSRPLCLRLVWRRLCEIAGSAVRNCRARGERSVEPGVRLPLVLHREVPQPLATLAKPY
jgi:hypothetical protein